MNNEIAKSYKKKLTIARSEFGRSITTRLDLIVANMKEKHDADINYEFSVDSGAGTVSLTGQATEFHAYADDDFEFVAPEKSNCTGEKSEVELIQQEANAYKEFQVELGVLADNIQEFYDVNQFDSFKF